MVLYLEEFFEDRELAFVESWERRLVEAAMEIAREKGA